MPNIQSVMLTATGNGIGLVALPAGNTSSPILAVKSLIAGDGIRIIAGDSLADVTISATGMPPLTSLVTASAHWAGSNTTASILPIFVAAYPLVVTGIWARIEQISSTPGTLQIVKASTGIAITAGTAITSAPFDITGTPYIANMLGLTDDITILTLEAGDCLGMTSTGNWTNAYGGLTIHMAPWYP